MKVDTSLGTVAVAVRGDGPPVVLLHANPGDHRDFEAVIPRLAQTHTTYAVDWPGSGDSPSPRGGATAMAYARIVPEILDGLGLTDAAFIGNSVGGYAAACLAIEQPARVGALVLVNSGGFSRTGPLMSAFVHTIGTRLMMRATAGRLPRIYLRHRTPAVRQMIARDVERRARPAVLAQTAAIWRSFASPEHDLRARAARITAPVLLVWGTRDPMVGLDARRARRAIPAATWCPLPSGHAPFAELPSQFLDRVVPFLDGQQHHDRCP